MSRLDPDILKAYDEYPRIEEAFQSALDESLNPRGPDVLYEIVGRLGLPTGANVVDLGCGEGRHSLELARRFRLGVRGIDPVPRHIELSNALLNEAAKRDPDLSRLVVFEAGTAGMQPIEDASADLIWCREVLCLVNALDEAFEECRRVMRAGGRMLIQDTFRTDRLAPQESESMGADANRIETAFLTSGFTVEERIELGSEWGERAQETTGAGGRRLLHAARLLRDPDRYIAKFGRTAYDIMLGDCLWHVYRMIGKLSTRVYLLRSPQ